MAPAAVISNYRLMESATASTPDQAKQSELLFTRAEYDGHRQKLERLTEMRDRDIPMLLDLVAVIHAHPSEARAQLREDLADIEEWIGELEAILRDATVIAETAAAPADVAVGRAADIEDLDSRGADVSRQVRAVGRTGKPLGGFSSRLRLDRLATRASPEGW